MAQDVNVNVNFKTQKATGDIKKLEDDVKGLGESVKESEGGFKSLGGGVNAVGLAFKAMGIGLVVSAFVKLKDMLGQNQVIMDRVSVATESLSFIFTSVINNVVEFGQKMTSAFDSPQEAIKSLWKALKENIVNRIEGLIDTFGALGKVIKGVFKRDLDLIKEGASEAGTAFIQLHTGLDEVQQSKIAETFKNTAKELKNTSKEAKEYGKRITELRNEVKLAEATQRGLQLQYQKEAEVQRQIRDDVSKTIEERIKANEELGRILDEQFEEEKSLALKKIELAQMEADQNKDNVDLQVALINAKTELTDLEERITGQKSEQLTNINSLLKEQTDLEKELTEKTESNTKQRLSWSELEANQKVALIGGAMGDLGKILGEESKAGKAMAIGQALIDTYLGANKALGQGGIFGAISAGAIIASGLRNVAKIKSTSVDREGGSSGGGGSVPSTTRDQPSQNFSMTPNQLLSVTPNQSGMQPVQAYVVENDISNSQALQEELEIQSTL